MSPHTKRSDKPLDGNTGVMTLHDVDPNDPAARNGWYAVNHGKLTLPNVSVAGNTVYWGEDAGGGPNRANAVKVVFAGRSGTGTLTGSLLAGDHGDMPAYDGTAKLAGVWRFGNAGFTFASADLTFRYDPAAVAAWGLAESEIDVYWNSGAPGATWTRLHDLIRDGASNRLTASGASGLGFFAVGKIVLPAGTVVIIR
jgi:hypothetical protein